MELTLLTTLLHAATARAHSPRKHTVKLKMSRANKKARRKSGNQSSGGLLEGDTAILARVITSDKRGYPDLLF